MDSGVARKPVLDMTAYKRALRSRLDPTAASLELIFEKVQREPKRVVFAEGEEEMTIRAALVYADSGYGTPVLVGREERIRATMAAMGLTSGAPLEIHNARLDRKSVV